MLYMDGTLTKEQAQLLSEHIEQCPSCKEAFLVYDAMMDSFAQMEPILAPEGLEEQVMAQICAMPLPKKALRYSKKDWLKLIFGGAFALLFGAGAFLVSHQEQVLAYLAKHQATGAYAQAMEPVTQLINSQQSQLFLLVEQVFLRADQMLKALWIPMLLAVIGLCVVEALRLRRK